MLDLQKVFEMRDGFLREAHCTMLKLGFPVGRIGLVNHILETSSMPVSRQPSHNGLPWRWIKGDKEWETYRSQTLPTRLEEIRRG